MTYLKKINYLEYLLDSMREEYPKASPDGKVSLKQDALMIKADLTRMKELGEIRWMIYQLKQWGMGTASTEWVQQAQAENEQLMETRYQVWEMDESCYEQIMNSNDGILRIKIR